MKNRYNANLMATVVAPRSKAVKACKAGNATKKQRALIEDYLARLIDMREWVLSTQGIVRPSLHPLLLPLPSIQSIKFILLFSKSVVRANLLPPLHAKLSVLWILFSLDIVRDTNGGGMGMGQGLIAPDMKICNHLRWALHAYLWY